MYLRLFGRIDLVLNWDKSFSMVSLAPVQKEAEPNYPKKRNKQRHIKADKDDVNNTKLVSQSYINYSIGFASVEYMALMPKFAVKRVLGKPGYFYLYTYYSEKEQYTVALSDTDRFLMFIQLLKIRQIGPKLAAQIAEFFESVEYLLGLIQEQDIDTLSKVPGLGKKKAALLVWYFGQPDGKSFLEAQTDVLGMQEQIFKDIIAMLMALGLKKQDAKAVVATHKQLILEHIKQYGEKEIDKLVAKILKVL